MKYRNVTVSGEIAAGTTTLARRLAEKLGWRHVNKGEWFRRYAREHNLPLEEAGWDEAVDRQVDKQWQERLKSQGRLVVEGWLAGFMAQNIPGVLKVLLVAPEAVRLTRFMRREGVNRAEAKLQLRRRTEENISKWQRVYGQTDFFRPDLYDLVIDTGINNQEQTLAQVYAKIAGINGGNFS
jgi:CMP/dCMP kinase